MVTTNTSYNSLDTFSMFMRSALDSSIALIVAVFISSALVSMNFKVSNMSGLSEPRMTPSSKLYSFQLSSPWLNFCSRLKAFGQIVLLPPGLWRCPPPLHRHVRRHGCGLVRDRPGHLLHHGDELLELLLSRHCRDSKRT